MGRWVKKSVYGIRWTVDGEERNTINEILVDG